MIGWMSNRNLWHIVGERVSDGTLVLVCNSTREIDPDETWGWIMPWREVGVWCQHCLRITNGGFGG